MKKTLLGAFMMLLSVLPLAAAGPAAEHQRPAGRAVFLDPAFGGKESGPVLPGKIAGKRVTLDMAKEVYRALRAQGVSVHLSRGRDVTVSDADRLVKARKTGGELYVSLRISRDSRNCVQVSVPSFPASSPGDGQDAYLMNMLWEKLQDQSGQLAQAVARSMRTRGVALCGEVNVRSDMGLEKAMLPAVIADWKTGGTTAAGKAGIDATLRGKIAAALAEGIREYGAMPAEDVKRQP